jgi:regulator of RNase E activity RraA
MVIAQATTAAVRQLATTLGRGGASPCSSIRKTPMPETTTSDDAQLFSTVRERLFTAVIGDVMDAVGLTRQFLPPGIRALVPGTVIVGRAMPVLEADVHTDTSTRAQPFGLMFEALDSLQAGEIYIATGGSPQYALWGGLMSTRARALGCNGAVLDGFHRDTREILALGFPVFSAGSYAQDQRVRGRVIDYRCPIGFANGCRVEPGDLIVGDIDGVLVVPRAQEQAIIASALNKVEGEERVRESIHAGKTTAEIFASTGIM